MLRQVPGRVGRAKVSFYESLILTLLVLLAIGICEHVYCARTQREQDRISTTVGERGLSTRTSCSFIPPSLTGLTLTHITTHNKIARK